MNAHTQVRHLMITDPVTVSRTASISEVRALLRTNPFHHLPVVSERGDLLGLVSATDLARYALDAWVEDQAAADAYLDANFSVDAIMTHEPVAVRPHNTVHQAAAILGDGHFHGLPVVDEGGRLIGMLTSTDLLRFLAA